MDKIEREAIHKEIEATLGGYAPQSKLDERLDITARELNQLTHLANRIVRGNFDRELIEDLDDRLAAHLPRVVENLLSMRSSPQMRRLQEVNPYFNAFSARIVRDDHL